MTELLWKASVIGVRSVGTRFDVAEKTGAGRKFDIKQRYNNRSSTALKHQNQNEVLGGSKPETCAAIIGKMNRSIKLLQRPNLAEKSTDRRKQVFAPSANQDSLPPPIHSAHETCHL